MFFFLFVFFFFFFFFLFYFLSFGDVCFVHVFVHHAKHIFLFLFYFSFSFSFSFCFPLYMRNTSGKTPFKLCFLFIFLFIFVFVFYPRRVILKEPHLGTTVQECPLHTKQQHRQVHARTFYIICAKFWKTLCINWYLPRKKLLWGPHIFGPNYDYQLARGTQVPIFTVDDIRHPPFETAVFKK